MCPGVHMCQGVQVVGKQHLEAVKKAIDTPDKANLDNGLVEN